MGKGYIQKHNFFLKNWSIIYCGGFFPYNSRMLFKGFRTVKESLTFMSLPIFAFYSWEKNPRTLNKFKYES